VAFLFNWIGFLLLMCFCHTIASRYGALAGFGLSLTKWTLIVKHSTDLASRENSWLWWLIMAFGLYIIFQKFFDWKLFYAITVITKDVKWCLFRSANLCSCHRPIFEHQAWLETTVRKCTRASTLFLLKTIESAPLLNYALEQTAFLYVGSYLYNI